MEDKILIGAGAGVVGLLLGMMMGGTDEDAIVDAIGAKVDSGVEASTNAGSEQLATMSTEIAGLKSALSGITENQTASEDAMNSKLEAAVAALTSRIDAVSTDLEAVVEDAGASQTAQIEAVVTGGFGKLQESFSSIAALATTAATAGDGAAAADEEAAVPTAPAAPEIDGVRVGQVENLLDGKARVFVSGINASAQTVRVAINGLNLQTLGQYSDISFNADGATCSLSLDGIVQAHVQMSARCAE